MPGVGKLPQSIVLGGSIKGNDGRKFVFIKKDVKNLYINTKDIRAKKKNNHLEKSIGKKLWETEK
jgi:hypothetical protein